jgi:hypothetical protein
MIVDDHGARTRAEGKVWINAHSSSFAAKVTQQPPRGKCVQTEKGRTGSARPQLA